MKSYVTILIILLCVLVSSGFAQENNDETFKIPSDSSGEENSALTDHLAIESRKSGERLFVIVRLGEGETSHKLNHSRLFNVKRYVFSRGFTNETSVFAEGERVKGEGRIEYYLGSKLKLITFAPRNKMPNLTCCEDYFPPVKKKTKIKKNTKK